MNIANLLPDYQITKTIDSYPLSLDMIKRHLRLDNDFVDDDDYIMELLYAAIQMAENFVGHAIAKTLNVLRIDDFEDDWVQIMEGNFISVVSVTNSAGGSLGTVHQTSKHYDYFTIEWDSPIQADPITITFYTGYDTTNEIPVLLKQAILIGIADFYDNHRSSLNWNGVQDSKIFERILQQYQSYRF